MLNTAGSLLITVGLILIFGGFFSRSIPGGIFGFVAGPALISYGVQLIK